MRIKVLKNESDKRALVTRLSNEGCPLMFFYDEVPEKNMPHEKVAESVTLIHPPYDYEKLEKWFYYGNWQAIFPGNKDFEPFNTFKTNERDIWRRMKQANVKLIIDSFHDDIEWNVIEDTPKEESPMPSVHPKRPWWKLGRS